MAMRTRHLTETIFAGGALIVALVGVLVVLRRSARESEMPPAPVTPPGAATESRPGFIYGRITTEDGTVYEGRLRWRGDEEAFWNDYFDGAKDENRWAVHAPDRRAKERVEIFGFRIGDRDRDRLDRPFMARFGDITRVVVHIKQVQVTLKSGTMAVLDRFEAGDIDDGVRVWDSKRGVVDVDDGEISTIEFLPTAPLPAPPARLYGTVRTRQGDFTGFIQWHRRDSVGTDELDGRIDGREVRVRYDTIRAIARRPSDRESVLVTRVDGSEMVLSGSQEAGRNNRGPSVDDDRYGRVVISWDVFERVDFSPDGSGPGYGDFSPGQPLSGSVTTRDGRRLSGRLVYDFDESETSETFDVSSQGVDYTIPFGLITSIVLPRRDERGDQRPRLVLRSGEELHVDPSGDLGAGNAGMLVFVEGREQPEYVPWMDVEKVDFDLRTSASEPRAR